MTKRKKEDSDIDVKVLVAAYLKRLLPYPAETVVYVLQNWPTHKVYTEFDGMKRPGLWWPSWSELYDLLEERVAERRLMLEALR